MTVSNDFYNKEETDRLLEEMKSIMISEINQIATGQKIPKIIGSINETISFEVIQNTE